MQSPAPGARAVCGSRELTNEVIAALAPTGGLQETVDAHLMKAVIAIEAMPPIIEIRAVVTRLGQVVAHLFLDLPGADRPMG